MLTGCWSSSPAKPQPQPAALVAHTDIPAGRPACADTAKEQGADTLGCAKTALEAKDYATADDLAHSTMERFPYSKNAAAAEELLGDIQAAQGNYRKAETLYRLWLQHHPLNERKDEVTAKYEAAQAK
jgi:TolA-binding protein